MNRLFGLILLALAIPLSVAAIAPSLPSFAAQSGEVKYVTREQIETSFKDQKSFDALWGKNAMLVEVE